VDVTGRLRSDRVTHFPAPPFPARPRSTGGRRPGTGTSRTSVTGGPGRSRPSPPSRARPGTAPQRQGPGNGCTSGWNTAAAGKTTPASCPSSRAPSSGSRLTTCPASATQTRSGCGLPAPAPRRTR
jgi:hypothetical protein